MTAATYFYLKISYFGSWQLFSFMLGPHTRGHLIETSYGGHAAWYAQATQAAWIPKWNHDERSDT